MTRIFSFIISVIIFCFFVLAGCQTVPVQAIPPLEDEGEVLIYLQPFPTEAVALRFTLSSISVVRDDGVGFPLELSLTDYSGKSMARQRLIASGRLPAGRYTGILVGAGSAVLKNEDRTETNLLVPEAPRKQQFLFTVEKKKVLLIALSLQVAGSLHEGSNFSPLFEATIPPRPLDDLTGYLSDRGDNAVVVFDKLRMQATGVIATGSGPGAVVIDARFRKKAYVSLSGDDAVDVIDMVNGSIFKRITLFRGDEPQEIQLTPDGQTLLVVNGGSDSVSFIDTSSLVERARVAVGRRPQTLQIDPTGKRAFVFNRLSNTISVIDIAYHSLISTITTGQEPLRGQFNRTGDRLYVIHAQYPYLFVIDPLSFSILQRQFMGTGIVSLKIDTRSDLLYLCKKNESVITIYNLFTFTPVAFIPTPGTVEYMTIDNVTNNLYAIVPEKKVLMIINLVNWKTEGEIDVNRQPSWVTMMGER
jgi:YVTN family beta-propeller protein